MKIQVCVVGPHDVYACICEWYMYYTHAPSNHGIITQQHYWSYSQYSLNTPPLSRPEEQWLITQYSIHNWSQIIGMHYSKWSEPHNVLLNNDLICHYICIRLFCTYKMVQKSCGIWSSNTYNSTIIDNICIICTCCREFYYNSSAVQWIYNGTSL